MQRDMDLIRKVLLAIEELPTGLAPQKILIDGYDEGQVDYHVLLLIEAGLIEGINTTRIDSERLAAAATRLTWTGHDFLDAAREPSRWEQARQAVGKIGSASIQVWIGVLTTLMTRNLGLDQS